MVAIDWQEMCVGGPAFDCALWYLNSTTTALRRKHGRRAFDVYAHLVNAFYVRALVLALAPEHAWTRSKAAFLRANETLQDHADDILGARPELRN